MAAVSRVFVGTFSQIMDTPFVFKTYGQRVEIEEELADKCNTLVPVEDFDALGHDPDDLKKFGDVARHHLAPPEFIEKRNAAWALVGGQKKETVE